VEILTREAKELIEKKAHEADVTLPVIPTVAEYWRSSVAREDELVRAGRYDDAERILRERAARGAGELGFDRLKLAALACARDDDSAYRVACSPIQSEANESNDSPSLWTACLLRSDKPVPDAVCRRLAQVCSEGFTEASSRRWRLFPSALSYYRAGDLDAAEQFLRELDAQRELQKPLLASARALDAMISAERGESDKAKMACAAARRGVEHWRSSREFGCDWGQWLVAELLVREAEGKLSELQSSAPAASAR